MKLHINLSGQRVSENPILGKEVSLQGLLQVMGMGPFSNEDVTLTAPTENLNVTQNLSTGFKNLLTRQQLNLSLANASIIITVDPIGNAENQLKVILYMLWFADNLTNPPAIYLTYGSPKKIRLGTHLNFKSLVETFNQVISQ